MYNKTKDVIKDFLKTFDEWEKIFTNFMPPIGYTLLKTFAKNKKIELNNFAFKNQVKSFLNNLNFFDDNCKILNKKVLPIRSILNQEWLEIDEITNEFWNLFKIFLWDWKENLISNMITMLWEMLNNIAHHSWTPDRLNRNQSFIEANYQSWQFFDKKNFIQIAITDAWIWILSSVRRKDNKIQTAEDAIKKALEPHFTWWTITNKNGISNAWMGLTVTREMMKAIWWDFFIWTLDCLYSYNWKTWEENFERIPKWKWTFIVLNIYVNKESDISMLDIRKEYLKENDENFDLNLNFW